MHTHCTHRYAHVTEWLGLMDVDEFLVTPKSASILPMLRGSTVFGSDNLILRLQAAMFGTSGHTKRPEGLVIDNYQARSFHRNAGPRCYLR